MNAVRAAIEQRRCLHPPAWSLKQELAELRRLGEGQEVAVAEAVVLGALDEVRVEPPDGGQVQAAQQGVEVDDGGRVLRSPVSRSATTRREVSGRQWS